MASDEFRKPLYDPSTMWDGDIAPFKAPRQTPKVDDGIDWENAPRTRLPESGPDTRQAKRGKRRGKGKPWETQKAKAARRLRGPGIK